MIHTCIKQSRPTMDTISEPTSTILISHCDDADELALRISKDLSSYDISLPFLNASIYDESDLLDIISGSTVILILSRQSSDPQFLNPYLDIFHKSLSNVYDCKIIPIICHPHAIPDIAKFTFVMDFRNTSAYSRNISKLVKRLRPTITRAREAATTLLPVWDDATTELAVACGIIVHHPGESQLSDTFLGEVSSCGLAWADDDIEWEDLVTHSVINTIRKRGESPRTNQEDIKLIISKASNYLFDFFMSLSVESDILLVDHNLGIRLHESVLDVIYSRLGEASTMDAKRGLGIRSLVKHYLISLACSRISKHRACDLLPVLIAMFSFSFVEDKKYIDKIDIIAGSLWTQAQLQ